MKTITIRLFDVESEMLVEVQKRNNDFKGLGVLRSRLICEEYAKLIGSFRK